LNNTDQLLLEVQNAVKSTVAGKKIGIAFSGGVDSALIAKTCKNLSYEITLLTIGFPGSHDIEFSKIVSKQLDIPHEILEIQSDSFIETAEKIKNIIKTDNLSWNENCIAFYYVAKLAKAMILQPLLPPMALMSCFADIIRIVKQLKMARIGLWI